MAPDENDNETSTEEVKEESSTNGVAVTSHEEKDQEVVSGDTSFDTPEPPHQNFRSNISSDSRRKGLSFPLLFALGACFLLGVASVLYWGEGPQSFPRVESGAYIGTINDVFPTTASVFVDKSDKTDSLFVVLLKNGFGPQAVPLVTQGTSASEDTTFLPITIEGKEGRLKFVGEETQGSSVYKGIVYNLETGSKGAWELRKLEDEEEREDATEVADIRLWLLLRSELSDVEQKITKLQAQIPLSEAEVIKLTQFVSDGRSLRDNAGRKLALERESLSKLQSEYKAQQEEVSKLERQVDLAHRVTSMGKLVSLARESLEREGRWISSSLRVGTGDLPPELEEAAIKGEKILELKRQIEIENERIYALMHPESRAVKEVNKQEEEEASDDSESESGKTKKKKGGFWDSLFGGSEND